MRSSGLAQARAAMIRQSTIPEFAMHPVGTIGTAVGVALVAMAGAYVGTFSQQLFGEGNAPAPVVNLSRVVPLPAVSVPIYQGGARIGYCVVEASAELPNGYSDEHFQLAVSAIADAMIRVLSVSAGESEAEALCSNQQGGEVAGHKIVETEYFRTVRDAAARP